MYVCVTNTDKQANNELAKTIENLEKNIKTLKIENKKLTSQHEDLRVENEDLQTRLVQHLNIISQQAETIDALKNKQVFLYCTIKLF